MVSSQRSSQEQGPVKKQQSISSFFTKSNSTATALPNLSRQLSCGTNSSAVAQNGQSQRRQNSSSPSAADSKNSSTLQQFTRKSKRSFEGEENDNRDGYRHPEDLPIHKKLRATNTDHIQGHDGIDQPSPNANGCPRGQEPGIIGVSGVQKPRVSDHASKYAFSSAAAQSDEDLEDNAEARKQKEILHQRFVKKLGRPDSINEIKRRRGPDVEELANDQEGSDNPDGIEEDQSPRPRAKDKKGVASKKGPSKLTPMEKQILEIKREHMDTILVIEVGYKFKFFGEDARVAAKELSIVCIPGKYRYDEHVSEAHLDRFASASIPVHRLHVHVKRLVAAGHKVGVVRQLETAALKAAGDNRNAPFVRKLTNLYTKGTYIDDVGAIEEESATPAKGTSSTGYLLCITESNPKGWGTDEKVHVGIVAVQPATGDVVYDDFEDGFLRSEIETRLLHIAPCEILIVGDLSKATNKIVQHLAGSKINVFGDRTRMERVEKPKTMAAQAYSHVSNFYAAKMKATDLENDEKASKLLENVLKLPEDTTVCLSAMITHLSEYGLEHVFDLTKYFQSFSARSHMLLNGTSLTSLEIYQNQTDHTENGSLFWTLNRTKTRFGQRMLRKWVGRPLLIKAELDERIAAVEELSSDGPAVKVDKVKHLLSQIRSDLEKSLIRIYYGKVVLASPKVYIG